MEFEEIVIGEQIWATENLNVEHYRNGDLINDPSLDEGKFWCDFTTITRKIGRFCELKNSSDVSLTGKLYNWSALTDIRGLAPEGWRIPKVKDFQKLLITMNQFKNHTYHSKNIKRL
ncbi:MAG: fibrobacter succinogenes major paralogous domain-containing protein [Bacteroidetes bacterium]|nr:fibrobacter succinogenes major paralogous domain-containing protein [Bacteroidota bacterium]